MSVVFDFNASPNDVAPVSPISFTVCFMKMEKEWIVDKYNMLSLFALTS